MPTINQLVRKTTGFTESEDEVSGLSKLSSQEGGVSSCLYTDSEEAKLCIA